MKIDWNAYYFPNEMMEQADAIENCMKALQDQLAAVAQTYREIERIYVVGSGDCYFIGHAAAYAFRKYAGVEATAYEAYDFYHQQPKVTRPRWSSSSAPRENPCMY